LKRLTFIFLLFLTVAVSAQTLSSKLDKQTLALGEPATLRIEISNLQAKDVQSAAKNELLPFHFEEINDQIDKQVDRYERVIEFAVFEEGTFKIPALDFKINGKLYQTIPYEIEVINTAQRGDEINDIMKNKEVQLGVKDYWQLYKWYVLGILILLAVIFVIYQMIKYMKRRKSSPVVMTNQTLRQLEQLRKKNYVETGNYRLFYVELIDIARTFITKQYKIPADVLLTDDLMEVIKSNNAVSPENEQILLDLFSRGDLVKFAKIFPDTETMNGDFESLREFVKTSSKDLEAENLRSGV